MARRQLSDETIDSIKKGVGRVLKIRGMEEMRVRTRVGMGARGRRRLTIELGGREDFPRPRPRKPGKTKKKATKKVSRVAARRTPPRTPESVLRGMHRVLKYRGVVDPVSVRLANQRLCWVCRKDASGRTVCRWEPC